MRNNNKEKRRQKLINLLILFNVYKKDDKLLQEMTLAKLEYEYRRYSLQSHPHGEFGLIQWV